MHQSTAYQSVSTPKVEEATQLQQADVQWTETEQVFNRLPFSLKLKEVLETNTLKARLKDLNTDESWFSVLFSF